MREGPPSVFRWLSWKTCLKFNTNFIQGYYENLKNEKCLNDNEETILKDVNRTFHDYPLFSKYQEKANTALYNILRSYSIYNSEVGYCQGMNFIAGFLLIVSGFREEECFWCFSLLMNNYIYHDRLRIKGMEGLYSNYFPLLQIMNDLFIIIVTQHNPELKAHFDHLGVSELMYFSKWSLSIFLYSLPLKYCLRIWDYVLAEGYSYLLSFSLGLLDFNDQQIQCSDFIQINELLSNLKEVISKEHIENLLINSYSYDIEWNILENEREKLQKKVNEKIKKIISLKNEENNLIELKEKSNSEIIETFPEQKHSKKNITDSLLREFKLLETKYEIIPSASQTSFAMGRNNSTSDSSNIYSNRASFKHNPLTSVRQGRIKRDQNTFAQNPIRNEAVPTNTISTDFKKMNLRENIENKQTISIIIEKENEHEEELEEEKKYDKSRGNFRKNSVNLENENDIFNDDLIQLNLQQEQSKMIEEKKQDFIITKDYNEYGLENENPFKTPNFKSNNIVDFSLSKELENDNTKQKNGVNNDSSSLYKKVNNDSLDHINHRTREGNDIYKKSKTRLIQKTHNKKKLKRKQTLKSINEIINELHQNKKEISHYDISELFRATINPINDCLTSKKVLPKVDDSDLPLQTPNLHSFNDQGIIKKKNLVFNYQV